MRCVQHPGPVRAARMDLAPCSGHPIEVTLAAGIPLEDAVVQALSALELDSAWLEICEADVEALSYVIPADAPDDTHVAWYSDPRSFDEGRIDRLGMVVGQHEQAPFLHGHGIWASRGKGRTMGHILASQTRLSAPTIARGIGLTGARFNRCADAETNFELFHVEQLDPAGGAYAALRLSPNQDVATGLDAACAALGWPAARVYGIGSVNTPRFEDGRILHSLPTEFLFTDAIVGIGGPGPEVSIVGIDETKILSGRLARGKNAVLVTVEAVLSRMSA